MLDNLLLVLGTVAGQPGAMAGERRVAGERAPAEAAAREALQGHRGARVLLVEDNEINQQIARELLVEAGLEVVVAADGREAVEAVRREPFALVLMDMHMPHLDGPDATRAIRALPGLDQLPIVAMTANVLPADRQRCADAGMDDFLSKPIEPTQLHETVARWLRRAPGGWAASRDGAPQAGEPLDPQAATRVDSPAATPAAESSADASADPTWSRLGAVRGLDAAAGLRRSGGKRGLYLSLLRQFIDTQGAAVTATRQCLADGDPAAAQRHLHTLKGVAGNLGLMDLQAGAAALEPRLQGEDVSAGLSDLDLALRTVVAELVHALGHAQDDAPRPGVAPPPALSGAMAPAWTPADREAHAALAALRRALAEGDPAALARADALAGPLRAAMGPRHPGFALAVRQFDFDTALSLLDTALPADPAITSS
jgi:two-component system sensor histidine kinase/response regulator